MQNFIEMIDTLTVPKLAKMLNVPEGHIRVMRNRNSVPPDHWPPLIKFGISYDKLVKMRRAALWQRKGA